MAKLIVTRGLPGCGKTTWARAWIAEDRAGRARVNRDDLRTMLDDGTWIKGVTEPRIVTARDASIVALLRAGVDVACDDTNLPSRTVRDLAKLAAKAGAEFEVHDMSDVPLDVCLARDAARDRAVGEAVIRDLHQRYVRGRSYPLPVPVEAVIAAPALYVPPSGTPTAVMVDVDGTVALMNGRSPYDETLVDTDLPNPPVIAAVRALHAAGHAIVYCSGRTEGCRDKTEVWLAEHVGVPFEALHMRPVGDQRRDSVVKLELFDAHIRHRYAVLCVLDDRKQVVEAWRAIGLTVFAVAEGDF